MWVTACSKVNETGDENIGMVQKPKNSSKSLKLTNFHLPNNRQCRGIGEDIRTEQCNRTLILPKNKIENRTYLNVRRCLWTTSLLGKAIFERANQIKKNEKEERTNKARLNK